ncbi:GNAT family N-acetyltransferase [Cytobacillus purgationiresistens]|uniref:GNAT family N-acyltransferase n=1 Tax=Cytobacillus purgationiresistens TaxID=863449 RepID=A0ABU0ACT9_9BACI|nr:GNAT family N-acetyltransferase [Cytobacillus purgationiresistens]MDQ0268699.1 putative GNAT family N-acyltransferase [Cytobacillus purgationiresistens]
MFVKRVETEKEFNDALTVRKEVFVSEQNVPEEEEIDEYENEAAHFVLYQDDKPGGAGRFRIVDGYGKVERICVSKDARKGGSGKAIMQSIESYAKEQGLDTLKLHAQTHAIPFYEKIGYDVISEEFLDAGIPHRTMKKNI